MAVMPLKNWLTNQKARTRTAGKSNGQKKNSTGISTRTPRRQGRGHCPPALDEQVELRSAQGQLVQEHQPARTNERQSHHRPPPAAHAIAKRNPRENPKR